MKTRVYIDGYNFYFGCLKGTPYKWLDPVSLIETLLVRSGAPESILDELAVKFFTAEITERAASDSSSLKDQRAYHLALHNHRQGRLQTIKGNYSVDKTKLPKSCSQIESYLTAMARIGEWLLGSNIAAF